MAILLVVLVGMSAASANAATIIGAPTTLSGNAVGTMRITTGTGPTVCDFAARSGRRYLGPLGYTTSEPLLVVTWRVPKKARALTWTISLRCGSTAGKAKRAKPKTSSVRVNGTKSGSPRLFGVGTLRFAAYAPSVSTGVPEPTLVPTLDGGKGGYNCASADNNDQSRLDGSTYCTGYCTWWVYQKRPEAELQNLGEAYQWYASAKTKGIPVGSSPVAGSVAWWNATPSGPDSDGHVAYVQSVNADGSIVISEMNHEGWNVSDTRTLPAQGALPNGYIYGGPAGNSASGGGPPAGGTTGGGTSGGGTSGGGTQGGGTGDLSLSAPSLAYNPGNDLPEAAAEGPGSSLNVFFQASDGAFHTVSVSAAGTAFSAPSIAYNPGNDLPEIAVMGPSNSLNVVFQSSDGAFHTVPVGADGTAFSAPSIAYNPGNDLPEATAMGPSNSLNVFSQSSDGAFHTVPVGATGTAFSAPSIAYNHGNNLPELAAVGPGNSLTVFFQSSDGAFHTQPVAAAGTAYSDPSIAYNPGNNLPEAVAEGPGNSLNVFSQSSDGAFHTVPVGAPGTDG